MRLHLVSLLRSLRDARLADDAADDTPLPAVAEDVAAPAEIVAPANTASTTTATETVKAAGSAPVVETIPAVEIAVPADTVAETVVEGAARRVVFIDPGAAPGGDGSAGHPYAGFFGIALESGVDYLVKAGSVLDGPVVLRGHGTEEAPISVGVYGEGAGPIINGSVVIEQASHLLVTGLTIQNAATPGVIIRDGAHDIVVSQNTIRDTGIGIWVGGDSGGGNVLSQNLIENSAHHGIAFDKSDHVGDPTLVSGNIIRDSGTHGIEINANGVLVDGNTVTGSGHLTSGSSGIHVYGGWPESDGFGHGNVIQNNVVTDTHESGFGVDGNGIQLDMFTSGNVVTGNTVSGNDGPGIILYAASGNVVTDNISSGNMLDRSGTHFYFGEIVLAGDIDRGIDLTDGNLVAGNDVTALDDRVTPIFFDAITGDNGNALIDNAFTGADGNSYDWIGGSLLQRMDVVPDPIVPDDGETMLTAFAADDGRVYDWGM